MQCVTINMCCIDGKRTDKKKEKPKQNKKIVTSLVSNVGKYCIVHTICSNTTMINTHTHTHTRTLSLITKHIGCCLVVNENETKHIIHNVHYD